MKPYLGNTVIGIDIIHWASLSTIEAIQRYLYCMYAKQYHTINLLEEAGCSKKLTVKGF